MLFENKFLRILSLGPPTGSKPFGLAVIILVTRHSEVGGPVKSGSGKLSAPEFTDAGKLMDPILWTAFHGK